MLSVPAPVLPRTRYYLPLKIPTVFRSGSLTKLFLSIVDLHRFDTVPDPDPTFHFDVDPDPDLDPTPPFARTYWKIWFFKNFYSQQQYRVELDIDKANSGSGTELQDRDLTGSYQKYLNLLFNFNFIYYLWSTKTSVVNPDPVRPASFQSNIENYGTCEADEKDKTMNENCYRICFVHQGTGAKRSWPCGAPPNTGQRGLHHAWALVPDIIPDLVPGYHDSLTLVPVPKIHKLLKILVFLCYCTWSDVPRASTVNAVLHSESLSFFLNCSQKVCSPTPLSEFSEIYHDNSVLCDLPAGHGAGQVRRPRRQL